MEDFTDGHTDSLSNSMESDPLLVGTHTADSSTFAIEKQLGLKPHVAVNLISHRQPVETVYTASQGWFSGAASLL